MTSPSRSESSQRLGALSLNDIIRKYGGPTTSSSPRNADRYDFNASRNVENGKANIDEWSSTKETRAPSNEKNSTQQRDELAEFETAQTLRDLKELRAARDLLEKVKSEMNVKSDTVTIPGTSSGGSSGGRSQTHANSKASPVASEPVPEVSLSVAEIIANSRAARAAGAANRIPVNAKPNPADTKVAIGPSEKIDPPKKTSKIVLGARASPLLPTKRGEEEPRSNYDARSRSRSQPRSQSRPHSQNRPLSPRDRSRSRPVSPRGHHPAEQRNQNELNQLPPTPTNQLPPSPHVASTSAITFNSPVKSDRPPAEPASSPDRTTAIPLPRRFNLPRRSRDSPNHKSAVTGLPRHHKNAVTVLTGDSRTAQSSASATISTLEKLNSVVANWERTGDSASPDRQLQNLQVEKPFQVDSIYSKTAEASLQNTLSTPPEIEAAITDPPVSCGAADALEEEAAEKIVIQHNAKAEVDKNPGVKAQQPSHQRPQRAHPPHQRSHGSLPPLPPQKPPTQQKKSPRPPLGKPPLLFQPGRKKSPASPCAAKTPVSVVSVGGVENAGNPVVPVDTAESVALADAVPSRSKSPTDEGVPPMVSVEGNADAIDNADTEVMAPKDDTLDGARGESATEESPPPADEAEVAVKESKIPIEEPQIAPTNSAKSSNLSLSDSCDSSASHNTSNPASSTATNSPATAAPSSPRPADKNDEDVINSGSPPRPPRRRLTVSTPVVDRIDILPESPVEIRLTQNNDVDDAEKENVAIADEEACEREEDADKIEKSLQIGTALSVDKESDGVCEKEEEVPPSADQNESGDAEIEPSDVATMTVEMHDAATQFSGPEPGLGMKREDVQAEIRNQLNPTTFESPSPHISLSRPSLSHPRLSNPSLVLGQDSLTPTHSFLRRVADRSEVGSSTELSRAADNLLREVIVPEVTMLGNSSENHRKPVGSEDFLKAQNWTASKIHEIEQKCASAVASEVGDPYTPCAVDFNSSGNHSSANNNSMTNSSLTTPMRTTPSPSSFSSQQHNHQNARSSARTNSTSNSTLGTARTAGTGKTAEWYESALDIWKREYLELAMKNKCLESEYEKLGNKYTDSGSARGGAKNESNVTVVHDDGIVDDASVGNDDNEVLHTLTNENSRRSMRESLDRSLSRKSSLQKPAGQGRVGKWKSVDQNRETPAQAGRSDQVNERRSSIKANNASNRKSSNRKSSNRKEKQRENRNADTRANVNRYVDVDMSDMTVEPVSDSSDGGYTGYTASSDTERSESGSSYSSPEDKYRRRRDVKGNNARRDERKSSNRDRSGRGERERRHRSRGRQEIQWKGERNERHHNPKPVAGSRNHTPRQSHHYGSSRNHSRNHTPKRATPHYHHSHPYNRSQHEGVRPSSARPSSALAECLQYSSQFSSRKEPSIPPYSQEKSLVSSHDDADWSQQLEEKRKLISLLQSHSRPRTPIRINSTASGRDTTMGSKSDNGNSGNSGNGGVGRIDNSNLVDMLRGLRQFNR